MKYIVTGTPPTPNGDVHLGHISGPFLAADVCTRLLRQRGHEVLLLSYSDDYQSYVLRQSRKLGESVASIASRNAEAIVSSLASVDIRFDHFLRALGNRYFIEETGRYLDLALGTSYLILKKTEIPHCFPCNVDGYEGFGRATCNFCGSPSDASQCEACARSPHLPEMGDMRCMLCNGLMTRRPVNRYWWQIGSHYSVLRTRRQSSERRALRAYLDDVLSREDEEWALTRPDEPGIPTAAPTAIETHTWFAGLAGYRATLREYLDAHALGESVENWWSPDTTLVHFLGFDCSFSHAVVYASLLCLEKGAPRQAHFITNRFLKLDGEDFSTSRNHAIWVRDLASQYSSDAIRLYTALHAPEDEAANFSTTACHEWMQSFYETKIENGSWRSLSSACAVGESQWQLAELANRLREWNTWQSMDGFSIKRMARSQVELAGAIDQTAPELRGYAWLVFSHCGEALHPRLSVRIRGAVAKACMPAVEWLWGQTRG